MSKRSLLRYGLPGLGIVLALAGATVAGVVAHAGTSGTPTRVTVTEKEYKLLLSRTSFKPGKYTFVVVNKGKVDHSLSIVGPGIKLAQLKGELESGASRSLTVTLKSGTYALWCPIDGHAGLGMKLKIKVSGGGATSQPATTGGTTTSGGGGGWG